ncbi:MAG: hypothetical protein M3R68_07550 [Acidobacteriota bacterium]|nr:hypothetical protein [Acidobacteriota bacterium]
MTPRKLPTVLRSLVWALACTILVSILIPNAGHHTFAQEKSDPLKTDHAKQDLGTRANNSAPAADNDYTKKIKEYTTEPYFLTELVDHLPLSDKVPSPDKVLGYIVGTPNKLTYTKDLYRYYRELAKASPRVRVFSAAERSEEGKEQLLVAVGDEALLAKLDRYKEITAKLADPRKISEAEAQSLIGEGKIFYWASGSIHSPETGSPEMLMELAYRLAVEESPFIQAIRKNTIVLITPALEVDGRDMMVDTYNYHKANPDKNSPSLVFWGKYVAHDNNRDGLGMALALTRNQMKTFLEYHPAILHDLHESVPFLYTSTGTGPYNAWLDPITVDEWQLLAYHEIEEMTKRGVPGVWTHGFYDGWAPNYMFYVANGHNAIGRFYETFGNGGADTLDRTVRAESQRDWFRPNPPQPRVKWSMRNNVNLQQSAILLAMNFVSNNKDRFLQNFYIKSKRSIAKATNEGPEAYVIPTNQSRLVEAADMINLLRLMGVEVQRADKEITIKEEKFPAGSYVVRMDQPYSRMADMLMDTQYYNVNDPRPYDDTGWTLGALRNVKTVRVVDKAILQAPMTMLTVDAQVRGRLTASSSPIGYVINHNTDNTLATLRYRLKDVQMDAAEDAFKIGEQQFNAGSFIIKAEGNPTDVRKRLDSAVTELGITAVGVEKLPAVKSHRLAVPRIAILHTWTNTQNDGWFRIEFDRFHVPYDYISDQVVRNTSNLRDKYDVIIFPPLGGSAQAIVSGIPMRGNPIPWKQSELTPNMGLSPDQTDDMRGGMGLGGVLNLQKFVQDGGLFVVISSNARIPIEYGITSGVAIQEPRLLQARGSIFNARFSDRKSPIAYGYDETLPIYFNQAPLFQVVSPTAAFGGGEGGPGGGAGRPSGRGSVNDPDIVQGMPQAAPAPTRPPARPGEEQLTEEQRRALGPYLTPPDQRPRVVLRFASDEKNLLISGMLAGGSELANAPAIIDVPVGRGHVVMFANNPMWRHQTQGSFFLLFNAALNFDSLNTERAAPAPAPTRAVGDDQ